MIRPRRRASKLPEFKDFGSGTAPTPAVRASRADQHGVPWALLWSRSAARDHRTVGDEFESAPTAGQGRLRAPRIVPTGYEAVFPSEGERSTRLPRNRTRMPRARHCQAFPKGETRAADAVAREAVERGWRAGLVHISRSAAGVMRRVPPRMRALIDADRAARRRSVRCVVARVKRGRRISHHEKNADQRNSA